MLANMSSQAKQLLFDKARRVLSEEDVEILKEDLLQVSLVEITVIRIYFLCVYSMKTVEMLTSLWIVSSPFSTHLRRWNC